MWESETMQVSEGVKFSARTSWNTGESALAQAVRAARSSGQDIVDLTVSNPTACGFYFEQEMILGALTQPASMIYDPDPRGIVSAREAVTRYYADHGAEVGPESLILTTSTSEAYSFVFRLLCDPGDEVLVAQPGYPLFDFLADLESVRLRSFPLFYDYGWWIDFSELESRIGPATRAIVIVSPNNPTGHVTKRAERERLEEICVRHGLALIVDEVFLDYGLGNRIESFACGPHPALTFVVSGLSKIAALPQMKVGWLACLGPDNLCSQALDRLEVISDTFLSMNAPAQHALATWLGTRTSIVPQILRRVRSNLAVIASEGLEHLPVEAGWSAVLRLTRPFLAESVVREAGIVLHPGSFYGISGANRAVVSLLGEEDRFALGMRRLKAGEEGSLQQT